MDGFILINKDKGPTSHDIVFKMRKIAKAKKVGHTGTLDPLATGLMVVCIGRATKASDYITFGDKAYNATMQLGFTSDTLDNTGEMIELDKKEFTKKEITDTIMSFVGTIEQIPPMYSAKKIDGQKLCDLARKGKIVERKPNTITIKEIKISSIKNNEIKFYIHCTKGTYIRSLIDDIGKKLNYGAVMTDLQRVKSGDFSIDTQKAYTLEELSKMETIEPLLYPVDSAFISYKKLTVSEDIEKLIKNGIVINLIKAELKTDYQVGELLRVYNCNNEFLAIMEVLDNNYIKLKTTFFQN